MPWMPSLGGLAGSPPPNAHIVGFGKTVSVFSSKQKPKELTIYGSDFKCVQHTFYALSKPNMCLLSDTANQIFTAHAPWALTNSASAAPSRVRCFPTCKSHLLAEILRRLPECAPFQGSLPA